MIGLGRPLRPYPASQPLALRWNRPTPDTKMPTQDAMPLVTVAFPTRNRSEELEATLSSIQMQDYPAIEVRVVDDGSADDTLSVLSRHERVVVYRNERSRGQCIGRNLLMRESEGVYVIGLDDDSGFTRPDDVREIVTVMEGHPHIGVMDLNLVRGYHRPRLRPRARTLRTCRTFNGCSHVIRRELVSKVPLYRKWMCWGAEEADLSLQAYAAGYLVCHYEGVVIHHRVDRERRKETALGRACEKGEYPELLRVALRARNEIAAQLLNAPFPECMAMAAYKWLKWDAGALQSGSSAYRWARLKAVLRGQLDILSCLAAILRDREPMSRRAFCRWVRAGRRCSLGLPPATKARGAPDVG